MRIRLNTGQNVELECNLDHTVQDVINYVDSLSPGLNLQAGAGRFARPLDKPELTIEEAKLARTAVT